MKYNGIRLAFLAVFSLTTAFCHDLTAQELFSIHNSKGKQVTLNRMLGTLKDYDVVFFGELHNNSVAHWLELQVLKHMAASGKHLILGMEMLEVDNQLAIDEYMKGIITEKQFKRDVRLWDNHATDYQPMVDFAKSNNIPLIATNIPSRYANLVYRRGPSSLDSLADAAKSFLPPLPIPFDLTLPGYADMMKSMGGHGAGSAENLAYAQAVKDATMAHFILQKLKEKCLHINGSHHSMNHEGIVWYLRRARPDLRILTIHTAESDNIRKPDKVDLEKADYLILTPKDVIKSY